MLNEFGVVLLDHLDERGWTVEDLVEEMKVLVAGKPPPCQNVRI